MMTPQWRFRSAADMLPDAEIWLQNAIGLGRNDEGPGIFQHGAVC